MESTTMARRTLPTRGRASVTGKRSAVVGTILGLTLLAGCSGTSSTFPTTGSAGASTGMQTTTTSAEASTATAMASAASSAASVASGAASAAGEVVVAAKGQSSAECLALSTVLMNATTIGAKAQAGAVTQEDVDRAFAAEATKGVPTDAMAYVTATKTVADQLIGQDAAATGTFLGSWERAFGGLTAASSKVCS